MKEGETLSAYYSRARTMWEAQSYCASVAGLPLRESDFAYAWTDGLPESTARMVATVVGNRSTTLAAAYEAACREPTCPGKRKRQDDGRATGKSSRPRRSGSGQDGSVLAAIGMDDADASDDEEAPPTPADASGPSVNALVSLTNNLQSRIDQLERERTASVVVPPPPLHTLYTAPPGQPPALPPPATLPAPTLPAPTLPALPAGNPPLPAGPPPRFNGNSRGRSRGGRGSRGTGGRGRGNVECFHCHGPHFLRNCTTYPGCQHCSSKSHTSPYCPTLRTTAAGSQAAPTAAVVASS